MEMLGIAGARGLGAVLARLALRAGLEVLIFDQNVQSLEETREKLARGLSASPDHGGASGGALPHGRLRVTSDIAEMAGADTIVETVVDSRDGKRALLVRLEAACSEQTVLCTTTATQSISALAAALSRPELLVGLHVLRPAATTRAVEIVQGLRTSQAAIERAHTLARALGKTPIAVKNRPGFVVDRLAGQMRQEAVYALEEGVADAGAIDALHEAMGFVSGPLAQLDTMGLDHALTAGRALFENSLGESRFRPSLLLLEMVDAGWTGRKAGKGFHDYGTH